MDNIYCIAYVDRIRSGKKIFYYLGKTVRISENKWKKIRVKIGEKEPTKAEISKKLKELNIEEYNLYNKDYWNESLRLHIKNSKGNKNNILPACQ